MDKETIAPQNDIITPKDAYDKMHAEIENAENKLKETGKGGFVSKLKEIHDAERAKEDKESAEQVLKNDREVLTDKAMD